MLEFVANIVWPVCDLPCVLWRCWLSGRKGIRPVKKQSGGVLAWLSVCLQTCIWPSWCHCHSSSLASLKSRLVLPFWYRLTWVVLEKGPLNGCVCVCVCVRACVCAWERERERDLCRIVAAKWWPAVCSENAITWARCLADNWQPSFYWAKAGKCFECLCVALFG